MGQQIENQALSITAQICTVEFVLGQNLVIPPYQRPYTWTQKNVMQLLTDIRTSMVAGKREYRIGTVICHKYINAEKKEQYDIVDGQQRITTILMVLRELEVEWIDKITRPNIKYKRNSVERIRENCNFIKGWIKDNLPSDKETFAKYILDNCKFVEIDVNDLGEAFQMFDTQNGRGKSLEAYNLLKAFHIRAMEQNSQEERIQCDRNWESATQYDATPDIQTDPNEDILGQLFGEQLFKSRLWCRNEEAKAFTRSDIEEFKGFTIDKNHPIDYPFQNPFLLQYLTEKFYRNVLAGTIGTKSRLESGETEKANPFVNINQDIINGKAFFEYIETYVELYKKMFIELGCYQLADFKRFFYLHCLSYKWENNSKEERDAHKTDAQITWEKAILRQDAFRDAKGGAERVGDKYLRETYKSLCFVLLDKFGEKVFMRYYKTLYRLVYLNRLKYGAIKFSTAMSAPTAFFSDIYRAKNEADLLELTNKLSVALKDKEKYDNNKNKIQNNKLQTFIMEGKDDE